MSLNIRFPRSGVTRFTMALLVITVLVASCAPLFAQSTISTGSIQGRHRPERRGCHAAPK